MVGALSRRPGPWLVITRHRAMATEGIKVYSFRWSLQQGKASMMTLAVVNELPKSIDGLAGERGTDVSSLASPRFALRVHGCKWQNVSKERKESHPWCLHLSGGPRSPWQVLPPRHWSCSWNEWKYGKRERYRLCHQHSQVPQSSGKCVLSAFFVSAPEACFVLEPHRSHGFVRGRDG